MGVYQTGVSIPVGTKFWTVVVTGTFVFVRTHCRFIKSERAF